MHLGLIPCNCDLIKANEELSELLKPSIIFWTDDEIISKPVSSHIVKYTLISRVVILIYKIRSAPCFLKFIFLSPGVLFVSDNGELWASGAHPQLGINSVIPKKISFFDGRFVVAVGCGDDFCVLVTHKKDEVCLY